MKNSLFVAVTALVLATLPASAIPVDVPDTGSTVGLAAVALVGLALARRFFR